MEEIEVDEDVIALLRSKAVPFKDTPNTVLRRLLGLDPALDGDGVLIFNPVGPRPTKKEMKARPLKRLIYAGLVKAGDTLVLPRPRSGELFEATVTEDGRMETNGNYFEKPSPAAAFCTGTQMNGYSAWRLGEAIGPSLNELNKRAARMGL